MTNWKVFLQQQGAHFDGELLTDFGESCGDYPELTEQSLLFDLSTLSAVSLQGDNSSQLLQGQTTCDLRQLSSTNSLVGAQCTPKGRAISNFRIVQQDDHINLLILPTDQIDNQINALSKYAPFFKTTITSAAGETQLLGVCGDKAEQACLDSIGGAPEGIHEIFKGEQATLCKVADRRYLIITSTENRQRLWNQLSQQLSPAGTPLWGLLSIRDGLGDVIAKTSEMFIPQMLNLQSVGAINFKKGCYTGQEIVARMHYLGKLKRRMYHLRISTNQPPQPGEDCYSSDSTKSIGNVVCAAQADNNCVELLAVLTEQGANSSQLKFGQSKHFTIEVLPLPYSVETA